MPSPPATRTGKTPGEVALAALLADLVECLEQPGSLEDVAAQVDLADRELLRGHSLRVLGLDDALELAVGAANDAPVAGGVELVGREDRGPAAGRDVAVDHPREVLGAHKRVVAREDDHRAGVDAVTRSEYRGARALPLELLGDLHVVGQAGGHAVAWPHNAHDPARACLARRIDDPLDHGLSADGVQDLGGLGPHPGAPPGGHDENRERLGHRRTRVQRPGNSGRRI